MPSRVTKQETDTTNGEGFDAWDDSFVWRTPGKQTTTHTPKDQSVTESKEDEVATLKFRIPIKGIC